jgi:hypothetical protein
MIVARLVAINAIALGVAVRHVPGRTGETTGDVGAFTFFHVSSSAISCRPFELSEFFFVRHV